MGLPSRFIAVLLLLYVVKQCLLVVIHPPFTGHDEVAHFAHIRTVATDHTVARIPDLAAFRAQRGPVDLRLEYIPDDLYRYCRYVLDWDRCNDPAWQNTPLRVVWIGSLTQTYPWGWQYTANHPPLYYLLMSPVYLATDRFSVETQQYALRAAAIPFGVLVVLLAFLTSRVLFPGDAFVQIVTPTLVAFQPQVSYEAAMVNNDIVGIAVVSAILFLTIRAVKRDLPWPDLAAIGFLLGAGLLIKSTVAIVVPGVAVAIFCDTGWRRFRLWAGRGLAIGAIAGAVAWPWYLYLWRTYGNLSGLPQIAEIQVRWTHQPGTQPSVSDLVFNSEFASMRWRETWGEFGWRLIPLDPALLRVLGIVTLAGLAGLAVYALRALGGRGDRAVFGPDRSRAIGLATLSVTCLAGYAAMIQFGLTFQLTQARYVFPVVNGAAVLIALGWRSIVPERSLRYVQAGVVAGAAILNVLIYTQYVLPYWYLGS